MANHEVNAQSWIDFKGHGFKCIEQAGYKPGRIKKCNPADRTFDREMVSKVPEADIMGFVRWYVQRMISLLAGHPQ